MTVASIAPRTDSAAISRQPDARTAATEGTGTELEALQVRSETGQTLSPVEQGTLARLADQATKSGSAPKAANDDITAIKGAKTIGDFKVTGATKQDKADLTEALAYLQQADAKGKAVSPTAVKLLDGLKEGAEIHIVHDGGDQYDPSTGVIDWDPRSGLVTSSGQGTQSAALGLIHEVDHEVNGLSNPKPTGDGYDNTEEKRVITGSETTIAHDLHEPTRTDHRGDLTVEKSSIAHTEVAPPKVDAAAVKKAAEDVAKRIGDIIGHLF